MLSAKLVRLIEAHWEELARRLVREIRRNPETATLALRPEIELREWCQEILENLGSLLLLSKEEDIRRKFQEMGRARFEESVPLHEAVFRMQTLRSELMGFIREQGYPVSALHLYAEKELEQRITGFFDAMVYGLVRGYENAMRRALRLAG